MPHKIAEVGNIQLMENQFGLCLRGSHPLLKIEDDVCSNHVAVNCNLLSASSEQGHVHSIQLSKMNNLVKHFMEIEGLGIKVTPLHTVKVPVCDRQKYLIKSPIEFVYGCV